MLLLLNSSTVLSGSIPDAMNWSIMGFKSNPFTRCGVNFLIASCNLSMLHRVMISSALFTVIRQ